MQVAEIKSDYSIAPAEQDSPVLPEGGACCGFLGCGLCGSDLEKFLHKKANPGVVLGHEVVGVIEALSDGHGSDFKLGDRIATAHHTPCGACHYCRFGSESMCRTFKRSNITPGGFAQHIALTRQHLHQTAFAVPSHISDAEASCMEPLACVLKAVDRLALKSGQSALVIGLGFIGLLAAQVLHKRGINVIGTDLSQARLDLANQQGWLDAAVHAKSQEALQEALKTMSSTALSSGDALQSVDAAFMTVMNPGTLQTAFYSVRDGGQLLLFASASMNTAIDPSLLYYREINVLTSYSPSLAHLAQAAQLIFAGDINVAPLISATYPLADIAEAMTTYQAGQAIKIFITP